MADSPACTALPELQGSTQELNPMPAAFVATFETLLQRLECAKFKPAVQMRDGKPLGVGIGELDSGARFGDMTADFTDYWNAFSYPTTRAAAIDHMISSGRVVRAFTAF